MPPAPSPSPWLIYGERTEGQSGTGMLAGGLGEGWRQSGADLEAADDRPGEEQPPDSRCIAEDGTRGLEKRKASLTHRRHLLGWG